MWPSDGLALHLGGFGEGVSYTAPPVQSHPPRLPWGLPGVGTQPLGPPLHLDEKNPPSPTDPPGVCNAPVVSPFPSNRRRFELGVHFSYYTEA